MISPLILLAGATLHCTTPAGNHNLSFPRPHVLRDTIISKLGPVQADYWIVRFDEAGMVATAVLVGGMRGVIVVEANGHFTMAVDVDGTTGGAEGRCR